MRTDLLTPLQRRILAAVAGELEGIFLSGGSALGPFYLGHRSSADLDLFTRQAETFAERVVEFRNLMASEQLELTAGSSGVRRSATTSTCSS